MSECLQIKCYRERFLLVAIPGDNNTAQLHFTFSSHIDTYIEPWECKSMQTISVLVGCSGLSVIEDEKVNRILKVPRLTLHVFLRKQML